jgi:hypothetical protein
LLDSNELNRYIRENYETKTDQQLAELLGISPKAVRERRRRMGLSKTNPIPGLEGQFVKTSTKDTGITIFEKLLQENQIDISQVGSVRISSWQQGQKNQDGDAEVVNLGGAAITLKVDPTWQEGPAWPVVQPATPRTIKPVAIIKTNRKLKRAMIFPDIQFGYRRDITSGELDPFHDERALSVSMQIAKDVQPDLMINIGDLLDFPQFGRFAQEPGFQMTVQPTIDRAYDYLCEQKATVPSAEDYVYFEGNHDLRLQNFIIQNALAAFGLKQAQKPDSWPVLSVQNLLRLDELGITYVDGYPAGEYYINDRLRCEHGKKTAPRGKIASKIVDDERVSTITGHNHRVEQVYKTTGVRGEPKINMGITLGCLCRIDGAVPSTKSAIDAHGRMVKTFEDWQQAVGIVEYVEGDGPFAITPVLIYEGSAIYNGKTYQA